MDKIDKIWYVNIDCIVEYNFRCENSIRRNLYKELLHYKKSNFRKDYYQTPYEGRGGI